MPNLLINGSNLCPKTIKIQAWRQQNPGQEGPGAGLEASLAVLGHLGRFWTRLGPSWKRLGAVLEASWAFLGRESWPIWFQVGFQNRAQINKKSIQKLINFLMPLGIDLFGFSWIFGSKNRAMLARKSIQKSILS